jgi:hypothetical protein
MKSQEKNTSEGVQDAKGPQYLVVGWLMSRQSLPLRVVRSSKPTTWGPALESGPFVSFTDWIPAGDANTMV